MAADRGGRGARAAPAGDGPAYDYRPSVKFSLRDELRLLDEALDEARARPRPPAPTATPALPPMAHPALKHVSIHAAEAGAAPSGKANGQLAPSASPPASRQEPAAQDGQLNGRKLSSGEHEVNGHRLTAYNLLDFEEEEVVDRKRLLAAIICILQEELTRAKPTGG